MVSKVNLKARIERHSRVLKNSIKDIHPFRAFYHRLNYNIVFISIVFFLPVYPMFANFFYNTNIDFYRTNIDESSIIDSYNVDADSDNLGDLTLSESSYLSVNTVNTDYERDLSGVSQITNYEVKSGDSLGSIASEFGIDSKSIVWANNLKSDSVIHPGDKLKIPPVSGIIHRVEAGETLDRLASYYGVSKKEIIAQNSLSGDTIKIWQNLIIPGAVKKEPVIDKPIIAITKNPNTTNNKKITTKSTLAKNKTSSKIVLSASRTSNKFAKGYCTWYVAQYKNVTWRGNAGAWYSNARAQGVPVGKTAQVGSIVVFNGAGYNSYYGHVRIVVGDDGTNIIVKDMNYRSFGEITTRKVAKSNRSIKGYIYSD
ncbi:MAG: LysM peptidoglycan-binding domain-containing protein [Candidatus Gracilibacteria bacterium]|nr:LysM peptidoglycan-binding domain-containing protein [Candidatus Gracilibacteria bacterium]